VTTIQPYPSVSISDGSEIYTFDQKVPNEIVKLFFSYLKPDEIPTVAQVCRTWRTLASDFNLLKEVFYHSLPNPPQLEFRQERGVAYYSHLYQQLASVPENVKCNRYVLRKGGYPKEANYVHFSEYGFCFVHPKGIDIYDPYSGLPTVTYLLKHNEEKSNSVCSLALSDLYLAICYSSGIVEIRDRHTGQTIVTSKSRFSHVDFFGQDLILFDKTEGKLSVYNIKKKEWRILGLPFLEFFQKLNNTLLLGVDADGTFHLIRGGFIREKISMEMHPVAVCTDEGAAAKQLFIVIISAYSQGYLVYSVLNDQNFIEERTVREIYPPHAILFKHGYLWNVQQNGEISKIDPETREQSTVFSKLMIQRTGKTSAFWLGEKLSIYTPGEGMYVLDFGVTSQEIVSNIASAYQEDLFKDFCDFQPVTRLECLAEEVQKGILFCHSLLAVGNAFCTENNISLWLRYGWPKISSEDLKYYVKNYAQASTPEGRKRMLEEDEERTERENKRRRIGT
jgi:hypothetical protein